MNEKKKILHLTLTKRWFDMIASGEKKEEYRDFKQFWISRLCSGFPSAYDAKDFDIVRFRNGYSMIAPVMDVEWAGCELSDKGKSEWGFTEKCFIIKLGKILSIKNFNLKKN